MKYAGGGRSSASRAFGWHSKGHRCNSGRLHQILWHIFRFTERPSTLFVMKQLLPKKAQIILAKTIAAHPQVDAIVSALSKAGARVLLVGGAVRDLLVGLPIKDLDIEVHGISLQELERVLKQFGGVSLVGKAYGVLRLHGLDIDWSVPRTDSSGRKPKVQLGKQLSLKEAFARRDLTINALGVDLVTHELVDPFHGLKDLKSKTLRAPDVGKFTEDPLRFYRVLQFMGRFEMMPDRALTSLCKKMLLQGVSIERIDEEFKKLFLQSKQPSIAFRWLKKIGRLKELFPELAALVGVEQPKKWHPEGDVFEHTMQSLDAAAAFDMEDTPRKLIIMYAALCHDLGKPATTQPGGKAHGHAQAGVAVAKKLLSRMTRAKELVDLVCKLVRYHLAASEFEKTGAKEAAYKRLAHKLAPLTLEDVALVGLADNQGRNSKSHKPLKKKPREIETFVRKATKAKVLTKPEKPLLLGRDLLDIVTPGPELGRILMEAYELQLKHGFSDKEELKKRVLGNKKTGRRKAKKKA